MASLSSQVRHEMSSAIERQISLVSFSSFLTYCQDLLGGCDQRVDRNRVMAACALSHRRVALPQQWHVNCTPFQWVRLEAG